MAWIDQSPADGFIKELGYIQPEDKVERIIVWKVDVLYEAVISLIGKNAEFREIYEYYRTRKENPLKKMQSVVAVACKAIRVFYSILTKGVDYDGGKMLGDIWGRRYMQHNNRQPRKVIPCYGFLTSIFIFLFYKSVKRKCQVL